MLNFFNIIKIIHPKYRLDTEQCCRSSLVKKVKIRGREKNLQLKCKEKIRSHIKKIRNKTYYVYNLRKNRAKRCIEMCCSSFWWEILMFQHNWGEQELALADLMSQQIEVVLSSAIFLSKRSRNFRLTRIWKNRLMRNHRMHLLKILCHCINTNIYYFEVC